MKNDLDPVEVGINGNSEFHDIFRSVILQFGEEVITDRRLYSLMSDFGNDSSRKIMNVLSLAVSYRLGNKIISIREGDESEYSMRFNNLRHAFQEDNFLMQGIAEYMVNSFLYALELDEKPLPYDPKLELCKGNRNSFDMTASEDGTYMGNFDSEGRKSGFGISQIENNGLFAGEWKIGMRNGMGIEHSHDKQKYAGEYRFNRKNGIGTVIYTDGSCYSGQWRNNREDGTGILFFPNGEKMLAFYSDGKLSGNHGIYLLQDGSMIYGKMTPSGPDGYCVRFLTDGGIIEETWKNGRKQ